MNECHLSHANNLILASRSIGRAKVLTERGISFEVIPADIPEDQYKAETADQLVRCLAHEKTKVLSKIYPQALILGADTLIIYSQNNHEIIVGKPKNLFHAKEILSTLSGRTHKVITGLCLYYPYSATNKSFLIGSEETLVTFKTLDEDTITQYVNTNEPLGKSGAYAIQGIGRMLIDYIQGNEDNVIGMPVLLLTSLLNKHGLDLNIKMNIK